MSLRMSVAAAAILLGGFMPVMAETVISGVGTATCAQFAQAYKLNPTNAQTVFLTWVQGFLSGRNAALLMADNPTRDMGDNAIQQIERHLLRFCDQNPLKSVFVAALVHFDSLPVRKP